jgi:hypothetical protein
METTLSQPMLFDAADTAAGAVELFPEVWRATEGLSSPDLMVRRESLDRLIILDAARLSPLVAYVVATRIVEPDLELRHRVVEVLGKIFLPNETGKLTPPEVRIQLSAYFMLVEHHGVLRLLEVADAFPDSESQVAAILNVCSQSGAILAEVMSDRKVSLGLRRQAINFIGRVGFLDAIPALERLETRLESRINGQKPMPFAPLSIADENSLLPIVQATLTLLREP